MSILVIDIAGGMYAELNHTDTFQAFQEELGRSQRPAYLFSISSLGVAGPFYIDHNLLA